MIVHVRLRDGPQFQKLLGPWRCDYLRDCAPPEELIDTDGRWHA